MSTVEIALPMSKVDIFAQCKKRGRMTIDEWLGNNHFRLVERPVETTETFGGRGIHLKDPMHNGCMVGSQQDIAYESIGIHGNK